MRTVAAILWGTLLCGLSLTASADRAIVNVEHWPPWLVAHDPERKKVTDGPGVHLLQEIFDRMGVETEFRTVPWQRSLMQMEKGTADVIPMISRSPERMTYMVFTDPLYTDSLLLIASAHRGGEKACQWTRPGVLEGKTVGTVRNYVYGDRWSGFVKERGLDTVHANNDLTNLKKTASGRLDYTAQYYSFFRSTISSSSVQSEKLRVCERPVETIPLRVGISRKSPLAERVDELNRILRDMKANGTYHHTLGDLYQGTDQAL